MSATSKFVWHDLMTTDVAAARAFYGELFGWRFQGGDHAYDHITVGERHIGGVMKLEPAMGPQPYWLGYVGVTDVGAATAAIAAAGGKVEVPRIDVPGTGTFAIALDPHGAAFAPFAYAAGRADPETNDRPAPWTFCWDELMSPDVGAAARFYGQVFGWGAETMDMPGFGPYTLLKRTGVKDEMGADKSAGGLMSLPPMVPHPFWMTYIAVPDADAAVAKATRLKATIASPPMDIATVGRFASLLDPQGAPFAILAPPA